MRKLSLVCLAVLLAACNGKQKSEVVEKDSIFGKPQVTKVDTIRHVYDSTGLFVDSLHETPKDRQAVLARFEPKQILQVYHDYKPLRKTSVSDEKLDQFCTQHKITREELKAILAEGDRLGWSS